MSHRTAKNITYLSPIWVSLCSHNSPVTLHLHSCGTHNRLSHPYPSSECLEQWLSPGSPENSQDVLKCRSPGSTHLMRLLEPAFLTRPWHIWGSGLRPTPEKCCSRWVHCQHLRLQEALGLVGARPQPSSSPQELIIKCLVRKIVSEAGGHTAKPGGKQGWQVSYLCS